MLLLSAVLGIVVGSILGDRAHVLAPLGTVFTRLLGMIVPLLVFFSISSSFANIGNIRKLSKWAGKIIGFFLLTTVIGTIIGNVMGVLFKPGQGITLPEAEYEVTSITAGMFLDWLPSNILGCIVNNNTIQIVFLAIFIGIAVVSMVNATAKDHMVKFLNTGQELMLTLVKGIMYYAPIGIFCLMADSVSELRDSMLTEMASFLTAYTIGYILQVLICYIGLFWLFTRLNPFRFTRKIFPTLLTAFTTTSSAGTMAVTLKNTKDVGVDEELADFGIPLGVTFNMDSMAVEIPLYIMLGMYAVGVEPNFAQLFLFSLMGVAFSVGCAGVPGGGLAIAVILINAFNLPVQVVAWIAAVFFYLDTTGTMMNVWGDAACTTIVAHREGMLDKEKFNS